MALHKMGKENQKVNELPFVLESKYGIIPSSIFSAKGGFSAKAAYHVVGADGIEYFVKFTINFYRLRVSLLRRSRPFYLLYAQARRYTFGSIRRRKARLSYQ